MKTFDWYAKNDPGILYADYLLISKEYNIIMEAMQDRAIHIATRISNAKGNPRQYWHDVNFDVWVDDDDDGEMICAWGNNDVGITFPISVFCSDEALDEYVAELEQARIERQMAKEKRSIEAEIAHLVAKAKRMGYKLVKE